MPTVVVEREITCRAERASLWCALADTERMNRAIGLGPITPEPLDADSAARFVVSTVSGGFPLEYEERPFEFVENERFVVRRVVRKGLVQSLEHAFVLQSLEAGGTKVLLRLSVEAPNALVAPVVRLQLKRFAAKIERELRAVDEAIGAGGRACFRDERSAVDGPALERAALKLEGLLPAARRSHGEKLVEFLGRASDVDVARIRPFELGVELAVNEREMLATCLVAVQAGLLELCWDLVCPSCRTASDRVQLLRDLPPGGHCQLCDLSYELEFDRAVEATFRPAPGIRPAPSGPFCIGGPGRTPHVVAQAILPAAGSIALKAPAAEGRYRLFVRGGAFARLEVERGAAESARLLVGAERFDRGELVVAPGAELTIRQQLARERHVKIERADFATRAATAHVMSTMPEFRRQFGSDVLKAGVELRVRSVALLFTDLTGSTALYERVGDAKAFRVVHEHFALLSAIVAEHGGSVVKTIGDAVMAAFVAEESAVRAAVAMQRAFPDFRERHAEASELYLRIGVHAGSCYVVTANGVLDYFGQAVNFAARLQGKAEAGEVVMTQAALAVAEQARWLEGCAPGQCFQTTLKGVQEASELGRVLVDAPAPPSA